MLSANYYSLSADHLCKGQSDDFPLISSLSGDFFFMLPSLKEKNIVHIDNKIQDYIPGKSF